MEDKILTMFFSPDRWEAAIEKGVGKDINKAAGGSLLALAKTLGCRVEDILEYDNSEIDDDRI